ncbi:TPA: hypothetical protein ACH3X1_013504 [Trebouxia sp. C0004]
MAKRRVQYGVVNASDVDVGAGAPGFRATWQSKADLTQQVLKMSDVPNHGKLYFWDGELWLRWDDPDDLPGPEGDPLRIKIVAPERSSENLKLVLEALEPIKQVCTERLSQTRCASNISKSDLQEVRDAFNTRLQVKNALGQPPLKEEEFWSGSCEVEKAVEYLRTIKHWARVGRKLYFKDARGHVLRRGIPLKFPISGSNDVVLILRDDPELAAFLGIELKRGLTAKGLRQAEVEFYLWASCSLFPFVQIITDMQSGGVAFYKSGSSPTGSTIVKQFLDGMDSVKDCVKNIVASIPDDAGEDGPCGSMKIPRTLENPARKRHREDTPESKSGAREAADGQGMSHYQRGLELIAAMQPDVGNELLGDLDDFPVCTQANTEARNAYIHVS